jgi:thiamine biosynthesis lipoprotein
MVMKKKLAFSLIIVVYIPALSQFNKYNFQQPKMGSLFNLVIYSADSSAAARAASHAYRLIDTLNEIYSDYLPQSELNRLCAEAGSGKWIHLSEPLFHILEVARHAGTLSNGTFDVTAGPLVRLWRKARLDNRLPHKDSLSAARRKVGFRFMELDTARRAALLKKAGMQLDLGGIAKGETAQRVCDRLRVLGFPYTLLDAGGDVVAGSVPPGITGWKVAINLPESEDLMASRLVLTNKAVTTSGDLYQYLEIDGKKYSHLINPVSGYAITNSRNVTVISGKGIDADWLTKACSILPVRKALLLIKRIPTAEVQIAVLKAGKPVYYRSPGFTSFLAK